jgi:pimeloyl-ACP methyl ester carboxylesterase
MSSVAPMPGAARAPERRDHMDMSTAPASGTAIKSREARPSGPYIETADGTRLFYKDWGAGKPLLFVHSWSVNADMWDYQMVELTGRNCRCIAYDRRGHGRSSQPGDGYDFDTLADDLATVIEELDLTDLTLIGHSMSGGEIIRYLTRHGDGRVARIALLGPTLPLFMKTADNPNGIDRSIFEAARSAWRKDFRKWMDDNAAPFFVPETSPGMTRWLLGLTEQSSLKAVIDCNVITTETDFRPELPSIKVPALILHGDKDVSVPLALAREAAALMPNCRLEAYEGAPHGLFITHLDRVNADLAAFIGV